MLHSWQNYLQVSSIFWHKDNQSRVYTAPETSSSVDTSCSGQPWHAVLLHDEDVWICVVLSK